MELCIDGLPNDTDYDELFDFFNKFGFTTKLKLRNTRAFVHFRNSSDGEMFLSDIRYFKGQKLLARETIESKRYSESITSDNFDRNRNNNEDRNDYKRNFEDRKRFDSYAGSSYIHEERNRSHGMYESDHKFPYKYERGYRSPDRYQRGYRSPDRFENSYRSNDYVRSPCSHCDKCEIHGRRKRSLFEEEIRFDKRRKREDHPNNKMKLVIDDLPRNVNKRDLIDFAFKFGFDPVYVRITSQGNHGIIEFKSVEERDRAMLRFKDSNYFGKRIVIRPYFERDLDNKFEQENSYDINKNNNETEKIESKKEVDIYSDINLSEQPTNDNVQTENIEEHAKEEIKQNSLV
ncbi:hypothetical protein H312_00357, partial [Anncaliia algerae PRA339]